MATTTNYGWTTPNDTDLVKDGAAAIRTLGSSIDTTTKNLNPETTTGDLAYRSATANVKTRLALGTAGQVLRVNSGATAPEWATTADQTPLTTKGDLFGFDTADARIPIGTNGHVLTADSAQTLGLKWAAPAGGGKVLQVVNVNYSTEVNSTSTSFIDTGLSASITPTSATSTILVVVNQNGVVKANDMAGSLILLRGATKISDFAAFGYNNANNYSTVTCHSLTYRDSPATTSSITYKTQSKVASPTGNYYLQYIAYSVVSVSSITLIEIGA